MNTLKASILRSLLAANEPWNQRPATYGESTAYGADARVASAGTSWTELHAAGITLQTDTHDRYATLFKGATDAAKDIANRNYRLAHGGSLVNDTRINASYRNPDGRYVAGAAGIDARVSPATCPSGLRPRIIKGQHKAAHLAAWHSALVSAVAAAPADGMVVIPALSEDGAIGGVDTTPQTRQTRATGPQGWRVFSSFRDNIAAGIAGIVEVLRNAEDQTNAAPAANALLDWGFNAPIALLDAVKAADFDTTLIRVESKVVPVVGSPAVNVLAFATKKMGLTTLPENYRVTKVDGAMAHVMADGMTRDIPVALANLARWIAPVAPTPTAWKPEVSTLARYLDSEVLIVAIEGETATVMTEVGDLNVAISELSAV